ncbi:RluA family pseudouridine synthase [Desulfurispira natronophila]|uniref:23S rRNA pseudouridine1911/1915/1917 synthase n=1 Tax=Desulfurispira natronophila TaxID=682562 RepID=A0A7W7Y5E0_9BACT|nr:RNA pseudouridine synthase [Desulfurispira natronophila]MBB5022312.1 23S rRNA pseudouridine1911/1915/1917 synthase [Desulfurispira natronophila]
MQDIQILHEDNHTVVVFKPPGIPMQPDSSGDMSLLDMVRKSLARRHYKTGNVFVGMVQRLDRPVSGLVVLGRTSKGASRLSDQIRRHQVQKRYLALVHGRIEPSKAECSDFMSSDEKGSRIDPHGKLARLFYQVLWHDEAHSLLEVELKTGRKHQIRLQLAQRGHPIVGDLRYGAPEPLADRSIALCAWRLAYAHPTRSDMVALELPDSLLPAAVLQLPWRPAVGEWP